MVSLPSWWELRAQRLERKHGNIRTRMSPWGKQFYDSDQESWLPHVPYIPDANSHNWPDIVRGRWTQSLRRGFYKGFPKESLSLPLRTFPEMTVPAEENLSAFTPEYTNGEEVDPGMADREGDAYPAPEVTRSGRCLLDDLPPELKKQILDYLVPQGCAYHFLQGSYGVDGPVQVIQQFVSIANRGTISAHTALAATNPQWNEAVCSILYGYNSFHFNIQEQDSTMTVDIRSRNFFQFKSWVRFLPHKSAGPLGPITTRTAQYLRSATLVIAPKGLLRYTDIEEDLARAAEILCCVRLGRLGVLLTTCRRDVSSERLVINSLDANVNESQPQKMMVNVKFSNYSISSDEGNALKEVVVPLLRLRADEVIVGGLITKRLAERLKKEISS